LRRGFVGNARGIATPAKFFRREFHGLRGGLSGHCNNRLS
jgi:hypothetical protein